MKATPDQVKAARMLLKMTQKELASAAGVSEPTLVKFETGQTLPHRATHERIQQALEDRGIMFTNGDNPGVIYQRSRMAAPN